MKILWKNIQFKMYQNRKQIYIHLFLLNGLPEIKGYRLLIIYSLSFKQPGCYCYILIKYCSTTILCCTFAFG